MAYRVSIAELGVANDNTVIEGATPGDVWTGVQERLKRDHKISIPDLEDLGGEDRLFPVVPRFDNAAVAGQQGAVTALAGRFDTEDAESRTIVTRLLQKLHAGQQDSDSSDIVPPGATTSPLP